MEGTHQELSEFSVVSQRILPYYFDLSKFQLLKSEPIECLINNILLAVLPFFSFPIIRQQVSSFFVCDSNASHSCLQYICCFCWWRERKEALSTGRVVCSQQLSLLSITWFSFIKGNMGSLAFIVPKKGWLVIIDFIQSRGAAHTQTTVSRVLPAASSLATYCFQLFIKSKAHLRTVQHSL